MISRIHGTLLVRDLDRVEVLTPGGVGYEIFVPRFVVENLPRIGEPIELRIHHVVREDAMLLFGFAEDAERILFARLLGASGVGPRLALALLSALPAERLIRAIRERDVAALTAVSGVGKKTAERIALELAGKLDDIPIRPSGVGSRGAGIEEAVRALVVLGFNPVDAERAVHATVQEDGVTAAQELIRLSLLRMR